MAIITRVRGGGLFWRLDGQDGGSRRTEPELVDRVENETVAEKLLVPVGMGVGVCRTVDRI